MKVDEQHPRFAEMTEERRWCYAEAQLDTERADALTVEALTVNPKIVADNHAIFASLDSTCIWPAANDDEAGPSGVGVMNISSDEE